ncbi:hypothetical protein [Emergencia timonensis]|uniref:hypothetical protein n=1 Tax=Emergencia timonensis TaxID=1776384 RepID=UPI003092E39E|nr:hypothetical protein CE91St48_27290 [Emergencia timonensis]BDF13375.1 hypothetical protein CE91St49_27220 [Emergencia timonensis]
MLGKIQLSLLFFMNLPPDGVKHLKNNALRRFFANATAPYFAAIKQRERRFAV